MADEVVRVLYQIGLDGAEFESGTKKIIQNTDHAKHSVDGLKKSTYELRAEAIELSKANGSAAQATKILGDLHHRLQETTANNTSRFRSLRNEMKLYSDIASEAGLKSPVGAQAAQLAQKAANELKHLNAEMKLVTSNTATLEFTTSFVKGIAGGFEVAAGAAALFGEENEAVEKTLQRLVAVQTAVNGITEVFNALRGKTGIIAEAAVIREKILAQLELYSINRKAALNVAAVKQVATQTALNFETGAAAVGQTELAFAETAVVAVKGADTVATGGLSVATNILSFAVKGLFSTLGLITIALGAVYLIYQSVTGANEEYEEALKKSKEEQEKHNEKINESKDKIAELKDKYDVLNGTLSETDAALRKIERSGDKELLALNAEFQKRNSEFQEHAHIHDQKSALEFKKQLKIIEETFISESLGIIQQGEQEKANTKKEAENKEGEKEAERRKKAGEYASKLSAEQRKLDHDRRMFDIGKFQDAEVAAAKGNQELILMAVINGDKKREAEIQRFYDVELSKLHKGSLEYVKMKDAADKAEYEAQKKVNEDTRALEEKYRKDLLELQKQYEDLTVQSMNAGVEKEIAQIDLKYDRLLKAEEERLNSNEEAIRNRAERNIKVIKENKATETDNTLKKENERLISVQLDADRIEFQLRDTKFARKQELIERDRQLEIDAATSAADLQNKVGADRITAAELLEQKINQINQSAADAERDLTQKRIASAQQIVDSFFEVANQINEAASQDFDKKISAQEKRVADAKSVADRGNAEVFKQEEERLDKLNKQQQEQADRAAALAQIQVVANGLIAVSQAATVPFPGNIVAIVLTLGALVAGLAKAKSLGGGFAEGGHTGEGGKHEVAGLVHRDEFVFTKERTRPNLKVFQAIHEGRIGNDKLQSLLRDSDAIVQLPFATSQAAQNQDSGGRWFTKQEYESMLSKQAKEIANYMPEVHNTHWTERGVFHSTEKIRYHDAQIAKHARN